MLKKVVIQQITSYFESEQWRDLIEILEEGRKVRHLHVYVNSILHPHDMAKIVEGYFSKKGYTLQRKIGFLGHSKGLTNVYYIHPQEDMAHFELFMNYDSNIVIEPADARNTREGKNIEYWDDSFMENYYSDFPFRQPESEEKLVIANYFKSNHWEQSYAFMTSGGTHAHVPVNTSIHPETLKQFGIEALKEKRWDISKVDSVVYSMKGYNQGKITYLLRKPEIVLELDWEFNPNVVIEPRYPDLYLKMTDEDFYKAIEGLNYYTLDSNDVQNIIENF